MLGLKLIAMTLPGTYKITARQVSSDGNRMQFRATGTTSYPGSQARADVRHCRLVRIKGEWKIDTMGWMEQEWPAEKLK